MAMFGWLFGKKGAGGAGGGVTEARELFSLSRDVEVPPAKAFEIFVDRFGAWWPRENTWAGANLDTIVIEPKYGGRCYERSKGGEVRVWGKVLTCDRPNHIVFTWQIRPDRSPEPEEALASRVDVRFIATAGKTEILVVHRDFPRHGDGWEKYKSQMAKTWPALLEAYVRAVSGG